MDIEKTINFGELQQKASAFSSKDCKIPDPQTRLYPDIEERLQAINACLNNRTISFSSDNLLAIFVNQKNQRLTIFLQSNDKLQESIIIEPEEAKLIWEPNNSIAYHPEALVLTPLSIEDFPIQINTYCFIDQKGVRALIDPELPICKRIFSYHSLS